MHFEIGHMFGRSTPRWERIFSVSSFLLNEPIFFVNDDLARTLALGQLRGFLHHLFLSIASNGSAGCPVHRPFPIITLLCHMIDFSALHNFFRIAGGLSGPFWNTFVFAKEYM